MKLIEASQEIEYIDIDTDRVPCSLLCKLTDKTYRMTFAYNITGDFFTVSLAIMGSEDDTPLVYGEVLRYGKPLFEAFNDERYPLPVICPVCLTGDDIDTITYENFGKQVKLCLFSRPEADD